MWLAFDIGTTGAKGALIDNGQVIGSASRQYPTYNGAGGVVEQNGDDWWSAVVEIAGELHHNGIRAVALTGQMQNVILVDGHGNLVRSVILYSDTRAQDSSAQIHQRVGDAALTRLTGNEQDASSLLAKLHHLQRHEPDTLTQARYLLLGAADLIAYRMTGIPATDTTTASTTGLIDASTRAFLDRRSLDAIGIGGVDTLFPHLFNGGTQIGALAVQVAHLLNLPAGIPVFLGPGDAGATTLGAGCGESGGVYGYLGTSGWVGFTAGRGNAPKSGTISLLHPKPDHTIHVAPLLTAGGNVDWIAEVVGARDVGGLIQFAMSLEPSPLLYLPYLNGERSPFRDAQARGAFVGLGGNTGAGDMARAVLEGVVYAYRHALETLLNAPPRGLTLTGGGTRSLEWAQLFADVLNLPVGIIEAPEFIGVRGAVIAAQYAVGTIPNYQPAGYFPLAAQLKPSRQSRAFYDHKYALFRQTYPALKPIFHG